MKTKRQKIKKKTKDAVLGGAASFFAYFCLRDGVPNDTGQFEIPYRFSFSCKNFKIEEAQNEYFRGIRVI